jgi:histidyl-tRNA synthetase
LEPGKLGKEIGRADKAGARAIVIIGPDDWAAGKVVIRDLSSGNQQTADAPDLTTVIGDLLNR